MESRNLSLSLKGTLNNKSATILRKCATKEFGLRSKGFVAYDLDPNRSHR